MPFKKFALLCSCMFAVMQLSAQTTITVPVNSINDDLEEYIPGSGQTQTIGSLDVGSSDLELGAAEAGNVDPQLVGIRFNNINIPKGAFITNAYIQFTVDATNKNSDPSNLWVKVQNSDNAPAFSTSAFALTALNMVLDSVSWGIPNGSWTTVGAAGTAEASSDISRLVQHIVDRNGWSSGNSMAFTIKGTGLREAESYDGSATDAPKLVITYIVPTTATFQINAASDDMEEWIAGTGQTKTVGTLDATSSDLELGYENTVNADPQMVGMRFTNLNIPKRAFIKSAYLQFTVDATAKNTDPANLIIKVQAADNPVTFNSSTDFDISSRTKVTDSITWAIPTGSWTTVGQAGANERSTNIARLLQAIVDRSGWSSGNAAAFFITGTGIREAKAYDLSPTEAVKLIVEYIPVTSVTYQVNAADDDQEEWLDGADKGKLDAGSSDLEFGLEDVAGPAQMVGLRFNNIAVPKNAVIRDARIRFTVDATAKNTDPVSLWVKAQAADNPVTFVVGSTANFDITSRAKIVDSVQWNIASGTWGTVGQSGADQTSTNIAKLTQALVKRSGWNSGNSMVYFLHGTGVREAESYDGSPADAARLTIEYLGGGGSSGPVVNINPPANYPLPTKSTWSYIDTGYAPTNMNWTSLHFNDTVWSMAKGPLGYKALDLGTTISYGKDSNNKNITTYYRKRLNIADVTTLPANLEFRLRHDDGAIIYVNGTQVLKVNMPGGVAPTTPATADVKEPIQDVYFTYDIPKTSFVTGLNIVAVEVHQFAGNSKDHVFDLSIGNPVGNTNPTDMGCSATTDTHIGCFTSLMPRPQNDTFEIPSTHRYQFLAQTGDTMTLGGGGKVKSNFDFTGYIGKNGSSREGWVDVNHERGGITGGVSVFNVHFDKKKGLWVNDSVGEVDFSTVVGTGSNCSGGVTPWGTSITCEETYPGSGDVNADGYIDLGWNVEVDPVTRKVKDYGAGPEKLYAMGRMSHENVVVHKDRKTVYFGEDSGLGALYKFVANTPGNLSAGTLYVLKLDSTLANNEPKGTTGTWLVVPNTTKQERNDVKVFGSAMGSTFSGIEDVEIGTLDSQIYFTAKGLNRIYRFVDNGSSVSGFMTYAGGKTYRVNSGGYIISEDWGSGNDNLTFDDRGNLWVLQDGGRNHVWIIRPGHTQTNPKIEVFMHAPRESEPTGMTFSPDYRFMFISIQEPGTSITTPQTDIAGVTRTVNKSTMMVIARKEFLGVEEKDPDTTQNVNEIETLDKNVRIYPNPFTSTATLELDLQSDMSALHIEVLDIMGRTIQDINPGNVNRGVYKYTVSGPTAGFYLVNVTVNGIRTTYRIVKQ